MRKLILSLAIGSTAALAAPASAQYQNPYNYPPSHPNYGGYGYQQGSQNVQQRIYQLRQRITRVIQNGRVSRNEAYRLQRDLNRIEQRYYEYRRNGLSRNEVYDLNNRIENLRQQIREDRRDGRRYDDDRRYDDGRYYDDDRY